MKKHGILILLIGIVTVLAVAGAGCTGTTEPDYVVGIDECLPPLQLRR